MATLSSPDAGRSASEPSTFVKRHRLPVVSGVVISAAFTALFVRSLDFEALAAIPARVRYELVLLAVCIFLLEFFLRAVRWQILLVPLGAAPFRPLLAITFIGFMANNLLPARAGELVRPVLAARRLGRPLAPILVTTIMERVFDLLGLLTVFVIMTLTLPGAGATALSPTVLEHLHQTGTLFGAAGILGMIILFVLASQEKWTRDVVERLAGHLPPPIERLTLRLYHGLAAGLASFRTFHSPLLAAMLSALMWVNGAFAIWIMTWSFGFALPFSAACFQSVTLALAVVVPQAPGFIGVWQVAVSYTLAAWGVPVADAQGFAMLFWLVSFLPVTAIGLVMLWREGLQLRSLWTNPPAVRGGAIMDSRDLCSAENTPEMLSSKLSIVGPEGAALSTRTGLSSKE